MARWPVVVKLEQPLGVKHNENEATKNHWNHLMITKTISRPALCSDLRSRSQTRLEHDLFLASLRSRARTTGRAAYFAQEYSDCRLLPLRCILLQNMTFKLRRDLLGIA